MRQTAGRGFRTTTILVATVAGTVTLILCFCVGLFLDSYRNALIQAARTSGAQAVSQTSATVGGYLRDLDQAMGLVQEAMSSEAEERDELLDAFLRFRPEMVAVTSYAGDGTLLDCWALGREPRETIFQNLSFDLHRARL